MASYTGSRLRYLSLALPALLFAIVGLGAHEAQAVPRSQELDLVSRSDLYRRDTVVAPPESSFVLNGLAGQAPQTRNYDFVISEMTGAPDGFSKQMLVVNGQFPGPTIEANQGDRLVIKVTNQLTSNRTTIHWHGLYQNGTAWYDGTAGVSECGIPPGESLTYDFELGDFSGSTWYHSHDTQYTDGITGALIVHPSAAAPSGFPTWDEDLVVQLTDVYHTFSAAIAQEYTSGTGPVSPLQLETPDSGAINGLGQYADGGDYFNFTLEANKTYRLRLIHVGSAAQIRFSVDYHPLTLIEADGTLLEPYTVTGVSLDVAQRYSVLLTTNQTAGNGTYWMRMGLTSPLTVTGTNTDIRGVITYGTNDTSLPTATTDPGVPGSSLSDMVVSSLTPAVVDLPPDRSRFYTVDFSIDATASGGTIAYMNTTSWTSLVGTTSLLQIKDTNGTYATEGSSVDSGNQFFITEDTIETVDILLVNTGFGEHPFHLHGHRPWIMGFGTNPYSGEALTPSNPLRRDTMAVPSGGWLMLRYISDNPGPWTLHCHIQWHMISGLLMQVNSLPSVTAGFDIPQDVIDQCSA